MCRQQNNLPICSLKPCPAPFLKCLVTRYLYVLFQVRFQQRNFELRVLTHLLNYPFQRNQDSGRLKRKMSKKTHNLCFPFPLMGKCCYNRQLQKPPLDGAALLSFYVPFLVSRRSILPSSFLVFLVPAKTSVSFLLAPFQFT
jgi:hypothetical protein